MTSSELQDDPMPMALLEAQADARRLRMMDNLEELGERMRPSNLLGELKEAAWAEVDRVTDEIVDVTHDIVNDGVEWVRQNQSVALGGLLTGVLAAGAYWYANRKKPVPLYDAYSMEDASYLDGGEGRLAEKAADAWEKVKGEAHNLTEKAEGAYYAARSKAAVVTDNARENAAHAADVARERAAYAAEVAREQAARAREVAGEAAAKARDAAGDAGRWAKRQPEENPTAVVLGAIAAGALIGLLMPSDKKEV